MSDLMEYGIEPCQWQDMSDDGDEIVMWHCHTHGYGSEGYPASGLCGCAQDQLRAAEAGRGVVTAILLDLIADMRDHYENCTDCGFMEVAADRAEQRLREVQGE